MPDVCWDGYCGISSFAQTFANLAYDLNLIQLVSESQPTHCAGNILDMVLTNDEDFHDVQTLTDLLFGLQSDHFMVLFSIITQNLKTQTKKVTKIVFNYATGDWENMCHYLLSYDFYPCLMSQDVHDHMHGITLRLLFTYAC